MLSKIFLEVTEPYCQELKVDFKELKTKKPQKRTSNIPQLPIFKLEPDSQTLKVSVPSNKMPPKCPNKDLNMTKFQ